MTIEIVDLPIHSMVIFYSHVELPEGTYHEIIWAMVNTHYMVDGHPIHNKGSKKIMVSINPIKSPLDD